MQPMIALSNEFRIAYISKFIATTKKSTDPISGETNALNKKKVLKVSEAFMASLSATDMTH